MFSTNVVIFFPELNQQMQIGISLRFAMILERKKAPSEMEMHPQRNKQTFKSKKVQMTPASSCLLSKKVCRKD